MMFPREACDMKLPLQIVIISIILTGSLYTLGTCISNSSEEDNGEVIFSLSPREGWRPERHHHLDPHRIGDDKWIACVDGYEEFIHPRHIK